MEGFRKCLSRVRLFFKEPHRAGRFAVKRQRRKVAHIVERVVRDKSADNFPLRFLSDVSIGWQL